MVRNGSLNGRQRYHHQRHPDRPTGHHPGRAPQRRAARPPEHPGPQDLALAKTPETWDALLALALFDHHWLCPHPALRLPPAASTAAPRPWPSPSPTTPGPGPNCSPCPVLSRVDAVTIRFSYHRDFACQATSALRRIRSWHLADPWKQARDHAVLAVRASERAGPLPASIPRKRAVRNGAT